ncbi:uncharacterized protein CTRU02_202925 [Colletotrichum truncatum]|uniref:Uncharacterized protein n=1 Tax=Colletotrichum truncatum TaxID=5467 RepID=A0ACC3ZLN6_COLTU|nr:uncharacterized protein CTRU02_13020 [Colletotrichum truncatum]KAF6784004.1 hypothetical protein CTRU02_13020 [Colletotrichum truncatum]
MSFLRRAPPGSTRPRNSVIMSSVSPQATHSTHVLMPPPPTPLSHVPEPDAEIDFPSGVITDHNLDPDTYRVTFNWKRIGVREKQVIHEVHAQLIDQEKVLEYWHQAYLVTRLLREQTLRCDFYHVFEILDHRRKASRCYLLVQWVGYSDAAEDTTWEPLSKIDNIAPLDVKDYLVKKRLWKNLRPWPTWKRKAQEYEDALQAQMAAPSLLDEVNQRLRSESTARSSADLGAER